MEIIFGAVIAFSFIILIGGVYCLAYSDRLIRKEEEKQKGDGRYCM